MEPCNQSRDLGSVRVRVFYCTRTRTVPGCSILSSCSYLLYCTVPYLLTCYGTVYLLVPVGRGRLYLSPWLYEYEYYVVLVQYSKVLVPCWLYLVVLVRVLVRSGGGEVLYEQRYNPWYEYRTPHSTRL